MGCPKQPFKQPTEMPTSTMTLVGRFPSLMGRFPAFMGVFLIDPKGLFYLLKSHWENSPLRKGALRGFLNKFGPISPY